MTNNINLVRILFWILCIYSCAIYLYTKGFLLHRTIISTNNTCVRPIDLPVHLDQKAHLDPKTDCWLPKRFQKAVILIIDGLRYDFVAQKDVEAHGNNHTFKKLTVLQELVSKKPKNAALYKMIADAPTTTMQRLKGVTTGGYPTFIDAGANFASFEIKEDNIIDQLVSGGKKVVFMGDDTWDGLFPKRFHRSYMYPSFNVRDLHTVDNGIIERLVPEMKNRDWDVLIAHGLGVDHCGHTYGSRHPAMGEKLEQYDKFIISIVDQLDKNSVLFVFGDHGMTPHGDHGGASLDELETALFVYSPESLFSGPDSQKLEVVRQVDIVPTFSLMLGIPIPFGNTGKIILDLFTSRNNDQLYALTANYFNVLQIHQFVVHYQNVSQAFGPSEMDKLDEMVFEIKLNAKEIISKSSRISPEKYAKFQEDCGSYFRETTDLFQKTWSQFNVMLMVAGLIILTLTICCAVTCLIFGLHLFQIGAIYSVVNFIPLPAILLNVLKPELMPTDICCYLAFASCLISLIPLLFKIIRNVKFRWSDICCNKNNCIACFCIFAQLLSFASNSYVVSEDDVTTFILQTLLWSQFFLTDRSDTLQPDKVKKIPKSKEKTNAPSLLTWRNVIMIEILIATSLLVRTTTAFRKCREEQSWCNVPNFIQPLYALPEESTFRNWRYMLSVVSLVGLPGVLYLWLSHTGNLNGYSFPVICASYVPPVMTACLCCSWIVPCLPPKLLGRLGNVNLTLFSNFQFLLAFICLGTLLINPLLIYIKPKEEEEFPLFTGRQDEVVHRVYQHIKMNWRKHLQSPLFPLGKDADSEKEPIVVYGLGTIFSSTFFLVWFTVILVAATLHSDGLAPSFTAVTLIAVGGLITVGSKLESDVYNAPISNVVLWHSMMWNAFFSTAHQATFPAIQWEAAFVGSTGEFSNYVVPAAKILFNTFSAQILFCLCLPLVILWPITQYIMFPNRNAVILPKVNKNGELVCIDDEEKFKLGVMKLSMVFLIIQGARLLFSMSSAAVLRRHLMVWKIFAPRFIFEALGTLFATISCLLGVLLLLRISAALKTWLKKIQD